MLIIYENADVLVIDKPPGLSVYTDHSSPESTVISQLALQKPEILQAGQAPRYGLAHRLDKETSGVLIFAKNENSLKFLQEQFKDKTTEKKYLALLIGNVKNDTGTIETLIKRDPKDRTMQRAYAPQDPLGSGGRLAVTDYKVLERFKGYTFLEVTPKTGRRHQIRCQFRYLGYPLAGDRVYGFKNQPRVEGLNRHFLHAVFLKVALPDNTIKEFQSPLPDDLEKVLKTLTKE